jgi:hypothetical protein
MTNALLSLLVASAFASTEADVRIDRVAQHLELVRNQMELTISNHRSLARDIGRQTSEIEGMGIYLRIPLATHDLKKDPDLLAAIRHDLEGAAARSARGFGIARLRFVSPWKGGKASVPAAVPFDEDFRLSQDQIVESRELEAEFRFTGAPPEKPDAWLLEWNNTIRRLLVPLGPPAGWARAGRKLVLRARIFRYRPIEYPRLIAPDLSGDTLPVAPATPAQKAAAERINKYREEIPSLWPRVEPCLNDLRAFALNDARISFYLQHAPADPHSHH